MPRSRQRSFSPRAVGGRKFVAFFHPAYPYSAPPLLTLAAVDWIWDSQGTKRKIRGIHYETALTACGIVACNRWDGYFAIKHEERGEPVRWIPVYKDLLPASGDYTFYFIIDSPDYRYPVVPSFDHWRFPHDKLPPRWRTLSKSPSVCCRAPQHKGDSDDDEEGNYEHESKCAGYEGYSTCFKQTSFASVVPFSHRSWYESNQMEKYCRLHGVGDTTVSNLFVDISKCFGRGKLRAKPWGHSSNRYELHPELILRTIFSSYRPLSKHRDHAASPVRAAGIHREHIFARLAFHILSDDNYRFLGGDHKYTVRLFDVGKAEQYTAELDSDDIAERSRIFPPPRYARAKVQWDAAMTPLRARQIMESFESDEEGVTDEEYDYPSDASEYRPSRREHFGLTPRFRINEQDQIGSTRHTESEDAVDIPDKPDTACKKRSYDNEKDFTENLLPPKRLRAV